MYSRGFSQGTPLIALYIQYRYTNNHWVTFQFCNTKSDTNLTLKYIFWSAGMLHSCWTNHLWSLGSGHPMTNIDGEDWPPAVTSYFTQEQPQNVRRYDCLVQPWEAVMIAIPSHIIMSTDHLLTSRLVSSQVRRMGARARSSPISHYLPCYVMQLCVINRLWCGLYA